MLRSLHKWRTRLVVGLSPTQVTVSEMTRGWHVKSRRLALLSCADAVDEPTWRAPLAALRSWWEQGEQGRTDVEVILSDSFARYALIPWSDKVQSEAEMTTLSRIQFESLFGDVAAQWQIQVDCSAYGENGIGCAIDGGLKEELQSLLMEAKLRLVSLQPCFIRAFNQWRSKISVESEALFVVVEPGNCVLATYKGRGWHSVRSFNLSEDIHAEVSVLVHREIMLQGLSEESRVYVHAIASVETVLLKQLIGESVVELHSSPTEELPVFSSRSSGEGNASTQD